MPNRRRLPANPKGFALLITITLLAFLVLLLVSLASLTRVETQVATNSKQLAQARQNALTALNIALGQLQLSAGPDQRATGRADLHDATNSVAATSSGLVAPHNGTRQWTGVWGNRNTDPNGSYAAKPTPVLLNWLVSGNENTTIDFDTTTGLMGTATAVNPPYHPAQDPAVEITTTATSPLTINGQPAALLVGANTVGITPATAADLTSYVAAPLVKITADKSSVPGLGTGGTVDVGRYAFWIGDEGIKANNTLRDRHAPASGPPVDPTISPSDANARYRFHAAQRTAIELFPGFGSHPINSPSLDQLATQSQLPLLHPSLTANVINPRYHDYTTASQGVLSDSLRGGLRKDLTHAFESGISPDPANINPNFTPAHTNILPAGLGSRYGPTWETLRAHYELAGKIGSIAAPSLELSDPGVRRAGVTPAIVQTRFFWKLYLDAGGVPYLRTFAVFALGNPYNARLTAGGGVDFSIDPQTVGGVVSSSFSFLMMSGSDSPANYPVGTLPPNTRYNVYRIYRHPALPAEQSALSDAVFRLPALSLEPGEVKIFTISNSPGSHPTINLAELGSGASPLNYYERGPLATNSGPGGAWSPGTPASPMVWGWLGSTFFRTQLRLANSTEVLQEIVNGTSVEITQKNPGAAGSSAAPYTLPVEIELGGMPLHLHLPGGGLPGGSYQAPHNNYRTYADYNLRARTHMMPSSARFDYSKSFFWTPPYSTYTYGLNPGPNFSAANGYLWNLDKFWGHDLYNTQTHALLFDVPRRSGADDPPVLSIGALQHANVTADDWFPFIGSQPGNAIGNSLITPYVSTARSTEIRPNTWKDMTGSSIYYDVSYLLNTALWDRFFFSSIPPSGGSFSLSSPLTQTKLPNPRLRLLNKPGTTLATLRDLNEPAARLMIDGAFNVNSTSENAWVSVLAGSRDLLLKNDTSSGTPVPRHVYPAHTSANAGMENTDAAYAGFRKLTDAQIRSLATEIVKQIKLRGPFLSLSHFINRTLGPSTSALSLRGPLQAAISASGINNSLTTTRTVNWIVNGGNDGGAGLPYADNKLTQGESTSTGIPGWLTQADLLQLLGPSLATRSDTFVIRTYGDVLDPVSSTDAVPVVIGRAWCEAVVQRYPDYIDESATGNHATVEPAAATSDNQRFGRRFRIVSFRWLTPNDI